MVYDVDVRVYYEIEIKNCVWIIFTTNAVHE